MSNPPQVVSIEQGESDNEFWVKVKNNSDLPLAYSGYGVSNIWLYQDIFKRGEWIPDGHFWCGTGKGEFQIPPGATRSLYGYFWHDAYQERIYASFSEVGSGQGVLLLLAEELQKGE